MSTNQTFTTLTVHDGNRTAVDLAKRAIEFPGTRCNPLFIYGKAGTGKSHLCAAIAAACAARGDNVWHVGHGWRPTTNPTPPDASTLIIDAIDELTDAAAKYLAASVHGAMLQHKQVVLAARTAPEYACSHGLGSLAAVVAGGVATAVTIPDPGARAAVLAALATRLGHTVPPDAAAAIAKEPFSGEDLATVLAGAADAAARAGTEVTPDIYFQALIARTRAVSLSCEDVVQAVSQHCNVPVNALKGPDRTQRVSRARQIAMYLCRRYTNASYPAIGRSLGGKDHTTAIVAVRRTHARLSRDLPTRVAVEQIEAALAVNPEHFPLAFTKRI